MNKNRILGPLKELAYEIEGNEEGLRAIDFLVKLIKSMPENEKDEDISSSSCAFPLPKEIKAGDNSFALFSDGACRGNPGPGAWGVVAQDSLGNIIFEGSGIELPSTNNKMELAGAIWALEEISKFMDSESKIYLYSDSKYVIEGTTKWMPDWKKRGWKKADKSTPTNIELWKKMDELALKFQSLKFIWVKGHSGHPQNEHCDKLANDALDSSGY